MNAPPAVPAAAAGAAPAGGFLDAFHAFAQAHIMRRPVIIAGPDTWIDPSSSPDNIRCAFASFAELDGWPCQLTPP
jgi:hypothetical protein